MQLEIKVIFDGGYHGEEWPPSPARLFQALIATRQFALLHTARADDALRWLESLAPPSIVTAPAQRSGQRLITYVPNNDDSLAHVRTGKSLAGWAILADHAVTYRWTFPASSDTERQAQVISAMAPLVSCLGRTVDRVFARGNFRREDALHQGELQPQTGHGRWLAPAPGFLQYCLQRYPRSVSEDPPDFTNSQQVDYADENIAQDALPIAAFVMWRDEERLLAFDPLDVRRPVGMFRHAMQHWADNPVMKRHYGENRISRLLFGHHEPGLSHVAIVPLPSWNADFTADGWLRRLMVVGYGCQDDADRELFADAMRGLHGAALQDKGRRVATLEQVNMRPTPWVPEYSAKLWRSVTPIVLTWHPRRGRSPERCMAQTLAQQGISLDKVASIMATTGPLVPHSESAPSYHVRDDYLTTPRYHAEIKFRTPQRGPLVIGRGRFVGLGLMMPATGETIRQTQESLAPRQSHGMITMEQDAR